MKSFIELGGIFIRPESITQIEPATERTEYLVSCGTDDPTTEIKIPPRVLIRTHGREGNPYAFDCPSFESAKEQARLLAEKVDEMLNPQTAAAEMITT